MIVSINFFAWLLITAIVYWIIPSQKLRNVFLSLASLAFIAYYDRNAVVIIILLSLYSWIFGFLILKHNNSKIYHRLGIVGLVLFLVIFKYTGLLTSTLLSVNEFIKALPEFKVIHLLLPLGISYITFKFISYLTDIYWGITKAGSFFDVLLYGSLFTIYVAGPIERFEKFNPQIENKILFSKVYISESVERIIYGIFKKVVIADWIGFFISPVIKDGSDFSIGIKFLAILGYSLQIYFDFSGYSDIAIGASRLYGLKIMENFNYPYLQQNISQFWRNWHISLSDWIRDYIFFPLSRVSRNKFYNVAVVPVIAMALCGLWHGSAWHFMYWGIMHGTAIAVFQYWTIIKKKNKNIMKFSNTPVFNIFSVIITFIFVTFSWLLFR